MSNRNRRVKHLEKIIRRELIDLETDILQLNEENSKLRLQLEEQQDFAKQNNREFRAEFNLLREGLLLLSENTDKNCETLACTANKTAVTLANAKKTLIGKAIFK